MNGVINLENLKLLKKRIPIQKMNNIPIDNNPNSK